MTPQTLEALKGSIEKWRKIVEEGGKDNGTHNCPLCELFWRDGCIGCPVSAATHFSACDKSPYEDWRKAGGPYGRADTDEKMIAARAEFEWLRGLLPQEAAS